MHFFDDFKIAGFAIVADDHCDLILMIFPTILRLDFPGRGVVLEVPLGESRFKITLGTNPIPEPPEILFRVL